MAADAHDHAGRCGLRRLDLVEAEIALGVPAPGLVVGRILGLSSHIALLFETIGLVYKTRLAVSQ